MPVLIKSIGTNSESIRSNGIKVSCRVKSVGVNSIHFSAGSGGRTRSIVSRDNLAST